MASSYVDRLLVSLSESDRQVLGKFLKKDSSPSLSFDQPLPDLREPSPSSFDQSR